ncbi:MAG TPA: hypothetical protein VL688_07020 [Verrucomicrobiae bacterium]|nr:hypothetical protein [Verrucomicrobiae bacterium]
MFRTPFFKMTSLIAAVACMTTGMPAAHADYVPIGVNDQQPVATTSAYAQPQSPTAPAASPSISAARQTTDEFQIDDGGIAAPSANAPTAAPSLAESLPAPGITESMPTDDAVQEPVMPQSLSETTPAETLEEEQPDSMSVEAPDEGSLSVETLTDASETEQISYVSTSSEPQIDDQEIYDETRMLVEFSNDPEAYLELHPEAGLPAEMFQISYMEEKGEEKPRARSFGTALDAAMQGENPILERTVVEGLFRILDREAFWPRIRQVIPSNYLADVGIANLRADRYASLDALLADIATNLAAARKAAGNAEQRNAVAAKELIVAQFLTQEVIYRTFHYDAGREQPAEGQNPARETRLCMNCVGATLVSNVLGLRSGLTMGGISVRQSAAAANGHASSVIRMTNGDLYIMDQTSLKKVTSDELNSRKGDLEITTEFTVRMGERTTARVTTRAPNYYRPSMQVRIDDDGLGGLRMRAAYHRMGTSMTESNEAIAAFNQFVPIYNANNNDPARLPPIRRALEKARASLAHVTYLEGLGIGGTFVTRVRKRTARADDPPEFYTLAEWKAQLEAQIKRYEPLAR